MYLKVKVTVHLKERDNEIRNKVEQFMLNDLNSVAVPDTKVKKGTRYRQAGLSEDAAYEVLVGV